MSAPGGQGHREEAGAEWFEPWCEEHDAPASHCLACVGASHDAWMHRAKAAEAEVECLREALEEIASGPDASKGEDYGCLDLHEARTIAREALDG